MKSPQLSTAQSKVASHQALTLTVNKLNESLKKRESEINKLTSDKEKLEAYTKKVISGHSISLPAPVRQ